MSGIAEALKDCRLSLYGESGLKLIEVIGTGSTGSLSLYGESGLKCRCKCRRSVARRLSLYGESGLKCQYRQFRLTTLASLSVWREWIEILTLPQKSSMPNVSLCMERVD